MKELIIFRGGHQYELMWDGKGKRYECVKCGAIMGVHAILCQGNKEWLKPKEPK